MNTNDFLVTYTDRKIDEIQSHDPGSVCFESILSNKQNTYIIGQYTINVYEF